MFSQFIAEIAAFLPYNTQDEPISIVTTIDKIISMNGSHLLSVLKDCTTGQQQSQPQQDQQQQQVDGATKVSGSKSSLRHDCLAAQSMVVLLELKRFLLTRFSLGAKYVSSTKYNQQKLGVRALPITCSTCGYLSTISGILRVFWPTFES